MLVTLLNVIFWGSIHICENFIILFYFLIKSHLAYMTYFHYALICGWHLRWFYFLNIVKRLKLRLINTPVVGESYFGKCQTCYSYYSSSLALKNLLNNFQVLLLRHLQLIIILVAKLLMMMYLFSQVFL